MVCDSRLWVAVVATVATAILGGGGLEVGDWAAGGFDRPWATVLSGGGLL